MRKNLLTLLLAINALIGQSQVSGTLSDGQNAHQTKFTQLAEKKQYKQAIEEGVRASIFFTENRQYKEAFAACRQMDAMIYAREQETKNTEYVLRYPVAKERLRMYTRLKNQEQCKVQLGLLQNYANQSKSDSLLEDLLFTEAHYYHTTGMADKSLACYKELFRKRSAGKDEKGTDQCYKDMLNHAEQSKNMPLQAAIQKLYTAWQDSIKAVKANQELKTLQQKYNDSQQTLQEKESKISANHAIIIALCIVGAVLGGSVVFLVALLFKRIRETKKLKKSLAIANENNEQKSHFISNINAQITPSLLRMEQAAEGMLPAAILRDNIDGLNNLMNHIQTYIALEETREERYPLKELNISTLCESIMEKAKVHFKPGVDAVVNVPKVNVRTHAEALERILSYLLENAALHTENGKITLEFKKRNAHTGQFTVTDTGCGISAEIRDNLFKPFAEIHDLTKGDGFGLPTCNLMAYKLNGSLHLDNEYKKGTRFVLELHDK